MYSSTRASDASRRPVFRLLLLVLTLSCGSEQHSHPTVPPEAHALQARATAEPAPGVQGPVRVLVHTPEGKTDGNVEVTAVFDRPMIDLDRADTAHAPAIRFSPPVPAKERWLGTRAVTFVPSSPLAAATKYTVTIPAGTRAIDGNTVAKDVQWTFSTPRPAVARSDPYDGSGGELPTRKVELYFNQRVSPKAVARVAYFTASGVAGHIGATASRPDAADPKRVLVAAARRFPLDAEVELHLSAGLAGDEGPLPSKGEWTTSFDTYGPFHLKVECTRRPDGCDPDSAPALSSDNAFSERDARRFIHVTPTPVRPASEESDGEDLDTHTTYYTLGYGLRAGQTYHVTISPRLRDTFGQRYSGPRTLTFRAGSYSATARLGMDGRTLEATANGGIAAIAANVRTAKLRLARVQPNDLGRWLKLIARDEPMVPGRDGVIERSLPLQLGPDDRSAFALDLAPALRGGRGLVAVGFGSDDIVDRDAQYQHALISVTDLAETVKVSPTGALVWVTRLHDAAPVAGARVRVMRGGGALTDLGATDANGFVRATAAQVYGDGNPTEERADQLVFVATTNHDATYVSSAETGVDPWDFDLPIAWDNQSESLQGYVFLERGIYRPGDTLRLKGIVRRWTDSGLTNVRGSVDVKLSDSDGNQFYEGNATLSDFGTFVERVPIPANTPLGPIYIEATKEGQTFSASADVEEYQPAQFEVKVAPRSPTYVRGKPLQLDVRGNYLFGAPMGGAKVSWTATWSSVDPDVPGHDAYVFGDDAWDGTDDASPDTDVLTDGSGDLDAQGNLLASVASKGPMFDWPVRVQLEATVDGLGGDQIANRSSVLVTPAAFMVGVKQSSVLVHVGHKYDVSLVAVDSEGHRRPGVRLRVTTEQVRWRSVRRAGANGTYTYETTAVRRRDGSCRATSGNEPVGCALSVRRPGMHVLEVRATDASGRVTKARVNFWAWGGRGYDWAIDQTAKIDLRADRKSYRTGQTAHILVPSPYERADALITVERAGIIREERRVLVGNTPTIDVPITKAFVPNAFVSVVLLRGRTSPPTVTSDPGRPQFKMGTVMLRADASAHRLHVEVAPDGAKKLPGSELSVDLHVRDAAGHPVGSDLAFYAVDEGVLSLTGYQTPDPFSAMYAARGLSVRTAESRVSLMTPIAPGAMHDKGYAPGGGGGGAPLRSRFESVAFYDGSVRTNAHGDATVHFRLPDNLTRFRLMAVAASRGGEFGSGESSVTTSKPLLVQAMLPSFVRVGDTMHAGVVLHSNGASAGTATVSVEAEGISVEGAHEQRVRVAAGGGAEVRFAFRATHAGTARFRFRARMGGHEDGIEVTRPVEIPSKLETVTAYGETRGHAQEQLLPATGVRHDVGGLQVTLASSALVGLEDPVRSLVDYPYECTEQLSSKLIPLASFEKLASVFGLPEGKDLSKRIDETIQAIEKRQRWDGTFGLWSPDDDWRNADFDAFLTAYALLALGTAKEHGHPVDGGALRSGEGYLENYLRQSGGSSLWSRAAEVYAAYALATLGHPDASSNRFLFEHRSGLTLEGRAMLAHTLLLSHGDRASSTELLRDVANHARQTAAEAHLQENFGDGYQVMMASDARSTAIWLRALLAVEPDSPLVPKIVRWLVSVRRPDGGWDNTQETTWSLLALYDYYRAREREKPDFDARISMGPRAQMHAHFEGHSLRTQRLTVPAADLPKKPSVIDIVRDGVGTLYYAARFQYARSELPRTPLDRGFFVERRYERLVARGGSIEVSGAPTTEFHRGDLVRVTLDIVVTQRRNFVVVDDPTPPGFHVVNFHLATATQSYASDDEDDDSASDTPDQPYDPFEHREIRHDRVVLATHALEPGIYRATYVARAVTPGHYAVPPTFAEEMYTPETFGRTAGAAVEVQP